MNPFVLAALVYPAVLAAPYRGTLDLADRTELRGGYFGFPTDPALIAETVPSANLGIATRRTGLTLGYAPRFALADLQLGINPSVLQNGAVGANWHDRRLTLSLTEYASYGFLNFSLLQLPASATAGTVRIDPTLRQRILYEASSTTFTAVYAYRHAWALRFLGSYSLSGGADEAARRVLPLQSGPRAELAFDLGIGRRHHLITTPSIEHLSLSIGFDYLFLQATQGYKYAFSRRTNVEIAGGIAEVSTKRPGMAAAGEFETFPVALLVVLHETRLREIQIQEKVDFRFAGQIGPIINRLTGGLHQQGQGLLKASWRQRKWRAVLDAGYSFPLGSDPNTLTIAQGQLAIGYALTKNIIFELGTNVAWQRFGAGDPLTRRLAFVAVTVGHPTLHF